MLDHIVISLFFQVSGPAAPAIEPAATKPPLVCTSEAATGSRVAKRKVCKPKRGFDPEADKAQDILRGFERSGAFAQPPGGTG